MTQAESNSYKYSDTNKRYQTYDYYLKHRFGGKAAKVSLDIGCTCPNIDGKCASGGCIYCLNGSSSASGASVREQYENGIAVMNRKWSPVGYIPYLQANSNTYGNIERLERIYNECASLPNALMLAIATRADCLDDDVIEVLKKVSRKIPLMIELGLQSSDDRTAGIINRGHDFSTFVNGYNRLRDNIENVFISVHIINGLPGENRSMMLKTASDTALLHPDMVKIHLCHVLRGTVLGEMYLNGNYTPMEKEDYVSTVCDQLELLPPDTVIGRITGDGMREYLLAPLWSLRKTEVANEIDKEMYRRDSQQGKYYTGQQEG